MSVAILQHAEWQLCIASKQLVTINTSLNVLIFVAGKIVI